MVGNKPLSDPSLLCLCRSRARTESVMFIMRTRSDRNLCVFHGGERTNRFFTVANEPTGWFVRHREDTFVLAFGGFCQRRARHSQRVRNGALCHHSPPGERILHFKATWETGGRAGGMQKSSVSEHGCTKTLPRQQTCLCCYSFMKRFIRTAEVTRHVNRSASSPPEPPPSSPQVMQQIITLERTLHVLLPRHACFRKQIIPAMALLPSQ